MKIKALNKKLLFAGLTLIIMIALAFSFIGFHPSATSAESGKLLSLFPYSTQITATAVNKTTGNPLNNIGTGYFDKDSDGKDIPYTTYDWKDISHFTLTFSDSSTTTFNFVEGYTISVQHLQTRPTSNGQFVAGTGDAATNIDAQPIYTGTGEIESLSDIPAFNYYINNDGNAEHVTKDYGWGIYRFVLSSEGNETIYSQFYYVQPKDPNTLAELKITYEETASDFGMETAYNFTITTADIKYVDTNLIRWYVVGSTSDGTKYVYHVDDLEINEYSSGYKALREATADRANGSLEFKFDTSKTGTWTIYCVVYDQAPTKDNINDITEVRSTKDDNSENTVTTGKAMKVSYIILIVAAIAVVLIVVLVVIIVKSVKKEKVW